MSKNLPATFAVVLQRKDPRLPVYVVVPNAFVTGWCLAGTTVVEGTVNGQIMGRRSMKRLSKAQDSDWFVEYTGPFCKLAGIAVGDILTIALWPGSVNLPDELDSLLRLDSSLRSAWNGLSDYSRRTSMEHIRAGKTAAARVRRAEAIVDQMRASGRA
jgi:hypothetical protein